MTKEEFIKTIGPQAVQHMHESKILASVTIAQAALESGWGKHAPGNMLFGIKKGSKWTGKTQTLWTTEYINGTAHKVKATFRAYDSWLESIRDHAELFKLDRYKKLIGEKDYMQACRCLKSAGYATDPEYDQLLIKLIQQNKLYEWDREEDPMLRKDHANIIVEEFLRPNYKNSKSDTYKKHLLNLANAVRNASGQDQYKAL